MADDDQRQHEVERFRKQHQAARVFVLTAITPFRPSMHRFVLLERENAPCLLLVCTDCPVRAPLDRGEPHPVTDEMLAEFRRRWTGREGMGLDAAGGYDGMTLRPSAPPSRATTSPRLRRVQAPCALLYAWTQCPEVRKALR